MDWLPNEDGMQYFVREILPRIRQVEPETTLSIIGRSPTPAVKRLADVAGVEVTGRVDDVRPHMADASIYVVPLRIGGGTRLKIFEAMAMGKAVVSTTVGAEGLPVTPGHDIVIADEPVRFAQAVVHLIRDDQLRRRIETEARRLVVNRYDWSAVAQDFEDALAKVCRRELQHRRRGGRGHSDEGFSLGLDMSAVFPRRSCRRSCRRGRTGQLGLNEGRVRSSRRGSMIIQRHREMIASPNSTSEAHATDSRFCVGTLSQERQPRSVVSRTRLRADRFGPEAQGRLSRGRRRHGAARHAIWSSGRSRTHRARSMGRIRRDQPGFLREGTAIAVSGSRRWRWSATTASDAAPTKRSMPASRRRSSRRASVRPR
jgi:hypothetical protein